MIVLVVYMAPDSLTGPEFVLCLIGCPKILSCVHLAVPHFLSCVYLAVRHFLSCVHLAVPHFCRVSIWLSHNCVLCLFWCPPFFPFTYLAVPQFCLVSIWQFHNFFVSIWLSHNFVLCLFGSPRILSCVYLAVPQFFLVSIWQSHNFVLCLFGSSTILSCVYLGVPQFSLLFIWLFHNFVLCLFCIDCIQKSIILCWQLTVVTDLYFIPLAPVCVIHMFPAVNWPNLLRSPNSLVTTKKNRYINNLFMFVLLRMNLDTDEKNCTDENIFL